LLRAGLASVRGDFGLAVARFEQAERSACDVGMALHAAVARHRIAELLGGKAGSILAEEARVVFTCRGIRMPKAWAAVYAPGCWGSA
jgi:hypothetical protein